jgi:hypothetical protein
MGDDEVADDFGCQLARDLGLIYPSRALQKSNTTASLPKISAHIQRAPQTFGNRI